MRFHVPTDQKLRSQLAYGTPRFPFAYFYDDLNNYENECIAAHWHREIEFTLVLEGTVVCGIGNERIKLEAGDGIFINAGTIHQFEKEDHGVMDTFVFAPEMIAEKSTAVYAKYITPMLMSDRRYMPFFGHDSKNTPIIEQLRDIHTKAVGRELEIRNSLGSLWNLLIRENIWESEEGASGSKAMQMRLEKMITYIHANYSRHIGLQEICDAASISKSEALRCFKLGLESTPVRYLNDYRLSKAKERLLSTPDPVTMVAEMAGFESNSYFSQAFKGRYGCSPNELRKRMTQKQ